MMTDNDTLMANMTANARSAARCLAGANDATKASALLAAAAALRASVADLITRAGFPPVHLAEINFQAMYEQQQQQAAGAVQ